MPTLEIDVHEEVLYWEKTTPSNLFSNYIIAFQRETFQLKPYRNVVSDQIKA